MLLKWFGATTSEGRPLLLYTSYIPTALAGKVNQSVASVCPSVRLFSLYLLNLMTVELSFVCGS